MKSPIRFLAAALVVAVITTACGSDGGTSPDESPTATSDESMTGSPSEPTEPMELEPESIRLMLATQVWGPDTATYSSLPVALGYWDDESLDVTLDAVQGGAAAIQLIAAGDADVTISGPDSSVWIPRSQGIPMTAFYNLVPRYFSYVAVPEDSPIQSYADMQGTSVGVAALTQGSIQMTKANIRDAGLDPENDVEFVAVGTGVQAANALLQTNDIDVWGLWDSQYSAIHNALGTEIRPIRTEREDQIRFSIPMAGLQTTIDEKPDAFIRLARGIAKATVFALENPECATKIHYEERPEFKPEGVSDEEAVAQGVVVMQNRLDNMDIRDKPSGGGAPLPELVRWGEIPEDSPQAYFDIIMKDSAALGPEPFDVADTFTNELIDAINDFDAEAIREAARACEY